MGETTNHEIQRILIQIEQMDDPESVKEIGQAAAARMRQLGVGARWRKPKEKRSIRKMVVLGLAFLMFAPLCSLPAWIIPPMFGSVSLFAVPVDQWGSVGIGTLGTICVLQGVALIVVYYILRGFSWLYDRARQEYIEDHQTAHQRAIRP